MSDNYRSLQTRLKQYRDAGFAVPALSGKYANLTRAYDRIQSRLQGQACALSNQNGSQCERSEGIDGWLLYQWALIVVLVPCGLLMFSVLMPLFYVFGDRLKAVER